MKRDIDLQMQSVSEFKLGGLKTREGVNLVNERSYRLAKDLPTHQQENALNRLHGMKYQELLKFQSQKQVMDESMTRIM